MPHGGRLCLAIWPPLHEAPASLAELVDALVSETSALGRVGSTPTARTGQHMPAVTPQQWQARESLRFVTWNLASGPWRNGIRTGVKSQESRFESGGTY